MNIVYYSTLIIAILVGNIFLMKKLYKIIKNKYNILDIVFFVYYMFFILPIMLDLFVGIPSYIKYPAFRDAASDFKVQVIYNLIVTSIPIFWFWLSKGKFENLIVHLNFNKLRTIIMLVSIIGMVAPFILVIFSPSIEFYTTYGPISLKENVTLDIRSYHSLLSAFTKIGIILACVIIYFSKNSLLTAFLCSPFVIGHMWIDGKRTIVILFIIIFLVVLLLKRVFTGQLFILAATVLVGLFFLYSTLYQQQIRSFAEEDFEFKYENFRIDYGRDHSLKMGIMYELDNNLEILEYKGQSLLFYLTAYMPRSLWDEKPYPYAQYFTSAMFYSSPKLWGWGVTTSIFDEMISNMGWLGLLVGPYFIFLIARIGEKSNNTLMKLFTIIVISLFMTVHMIAFAPMFIIWIVLSLYFKINKKLMKPV